MSLASTATEFEMDLELRYLYGELARLDVLLQRAVAKAEVAKETNGQMQGLVISPHEVESLFVRPQATPEEPEFAEFDQRYREAMAGLESAAVDAARYEYIPRLAQLRTAFALNTFEFDAFLICLASALDQRYERIMSYLQDDVTQRRPTANGIIQVLVGNSEERLRFLPAFLPNSRLVYHNLLRVSAIGDDPGPLLTRALLADESVMAWLLGQYEPDVRLRRFMQLHPPIPTEEDQLLAAESWETVSKAVNGQTVALFHGADLGVQMSTARLLSASGNMPLLSLDLELSTAAGVAIRDALAIGIRDARLTGAMLFLRGWDVCLTSGAPSSDLIKLLFDADVPVIVSSEKEWHSHGFERANSIMRVTLERPTYRQRLTFWEHFLAQVDFPVDPSVAVQPIASQFALTSRQIQDSIYTARDTALQRKDAIQPRDLISAARAHSSPNLSGLAQKIDPRYDWEDLVLPEDQKTMLREMVQTVKGRGVVMEEWGVGRKLKASAGVTVLFAGPPGTGKTMAAEVITSDLGLDLYKLDLSMVVSKFIGETEKNLGKIFDEAQSSSAVLFFDEADAIFGKRSEVKDSHDRYANMEVSYLLQRMEQYDGVTILATNLRANMDEAFTRRMQFIVDFPFPDEEERLRIWQTLFPVDLPQSADIDLNLFARRFRMSGGNIRNIIVSAAYLAAANGGKVTMEHLLHSTRRELQKMGRLITDMDLTY
ncbi:MAG: ATP-binding protein [Caldilineaceae bacterium]|nr:ATP-binding protein [Caldilineaceae bacterium]